jgi:FkbM family methyltransferase
MYVRGFVQSFLHGLGWDVRRAGYPSSEEAVLKPFLKAAHPNVVFDVGANIGQYGRSLRKCGFTGRIVSFEAISSAHAQLSAVAARDHDWVVAPRCAIGRTTEESTINISGNSVSSSLLRMQDIHLNTSPDSAYVAREPVRIERLDDLAESLMPNEARLMLKVDTQGYEEEVLSGAVLTLNKVCAMQLEMSVVPLYDGAPQLRRILELCEGLGFQLHGVIPGFHDEKTGRLLQMDGLFIRLAPPTALDLAGP